METTLIKQAQKIATHYFGISGEVKILPGELDLNFYVVSNDNKKFILKIANEKEVLTNLQLQNAVIKHLSSASSGLNASKVCTSLSGEEILHIDIDGLGLRFVRLLTWIDGRPFAKVSPHSPSLLEQLGEMCGKLCLSLKNFDHPAAHRTMKWDPSQAAWTKQHLTAFNDERRDVAVYFYEMFGRVALPAFSQLRMSVNYNDANDYNVLVSNDVNNPQVPGVIDFGDVVYTHTVNELAIALAYAMMDKPNPLEAACHIVRGFNKKFTLTETELQVLFALTGARLLISVTCSELNRQENPGNEYLQISDRPAWDLLKKLKSISPALAWCLFRNECGLPPHPQHSTFKTWAESNYKNVISPVSQSGSIAWLDLSVGSLDLGNTQEVLDADRLDKRISSVISESRADLFLGKYNEARAIYATDAYEAPTNDGSSWRTIHLGLDFFAKAGTPVHAAFDGVVHSFANNKNDRDYGPTIILEHKASDSLTFYTLYGHLNNECLKNLIVGRKVKGGDAIGAVGQRYENGNWTPHLHFQVMLDMLDNRGDFPGVCTPQDAEVWKSICPDPWLLLTGKYSPEEKNISKDDIVSFRQQHIGKNLSISYRQPIKMVRGAGQYLIDDTGRKYLDTVNNVAHVGHEHPRVVAAGQRQMAVLNTNTRYLHDNLVKFADELLATMPPELNVVFAVNSGSEANELAMRIAKTYTGQRDMIVSEVGYHGNTNGCIDISSYKFDGKGGRGKPDHVHVIPIPDTYRGIYRDVPHAGSQYAAHVKQTIDQMQKENKRPAAFIFESVISCGGQVELPQNFLSEAYALTRSAGGVCVADEVQTGCGRAGDYFWTFQQHQVVPDIVTIGKPIGNGHPLGVVVTTQKLADAFKNGMEYFNTFGGNPVSCAIGLEVLRVVKEEGLQQNAKRVGDYLKSGLRSLMNEFEIIGDVRGPGLFIGFELVKDRASKEPATAQANYFANRMRDKGILMSTDGPYDNVLKIKPPIIFSATDSDFLLESIRKVLKEDVMKVS
ncbi:MAG: aminotransferase class III-fold pyridoxal phosphate-dependent enzyme [Bacteroidetes bacterium]|nr:aminotransferase class III-fold pyridoxal phosphate-dependent enzyme [Bacteroidota bacterium]MBS1540828.1 aminotransferase class III-fold pyridoxal phosphate-dependent enzyme [Bacteroidota bacterium]